MKPILVVVGLFLASSYAGPTELLHDPSWRIVGGTDAPEGLYPYHVAVNKTDEGYVCGGVIIAEEWVISAAQCVDGEKPPSLKVIAGTNKLGVEGKTYQVLTYFINERYVPAAGLNDIVLLKVEPIKFNDKIAPIALERNSISENVQVILSSFGSKKLGEGASESLQHITLKTISLQKCENLLSEFRRPVFNSQLCTFSEAEEGICLGDYGSPLIKEDNGERTLVGIVSFGVPCARGYPDIYMKISSYIDWLNKKCNNCVN